MLYTLHLIICIILESVLRAATLGGQKLRLRRVEEAAQKAHSYQVRSMRGLVIGLFRFSPTVSLNRSLSLCPQHSSADISLWLSHSVFSHKLCGNEPSLVNSSFPILLRLHASVTPQAMDVSMSYFCSSV